MAGIKESKEVLDLGLGLGMAVKGALADGKFGLEDLMHLVPVMGLVTPAVENAEAVVGEMKDLDASEAAELVAHVASKLGDTKAEAIAGASLRAGLAVAQLISVIVKDDAPGAA